MALNITICDPPKLQNGAMPNYLQIPTKEAIAAGKAPAGQAVTAGNQSGKISGPCVLRLLPEETVRIDLTTAAGYVAVSSPSMRLLLAVVQYLALPAGDYYLNVTASM